jgi:hypothetical protein
MTYKLVQLAEGAYDVQRSGEVIASLVVATATRGSDRWCAELLDETSPYPSPFTAASNTFPTFSDALAWFGDPEVVSSPAP